jgi:hypothetical protein
MIVIKNDTEFIDFNKSTFFDKYYIYGTTIKIYLTLENRLSNNLIEFDDIIHDDDGSDRYFRWFIPQTFIDLDRGTYKFIIKLENIETEIFDEYEIGILEREIENDFDDLEYNSDDNDDDDVFVY